MLVVNKHLRPQAFEIMCHPLLIQGEIRDVRCSSIDDIEQSLEALQIDSWGAL
jgi:hypothetical protein